MNHLKPEETLQATINAGAAKAAGSFKRLVILGLLAGSFIALAGCAANMATFNLLGNPDTFGIGKAFSGVIFTGGLIMVVLAGGELFTGNCLMITSVIKGRIRVSAMLRNWIIVYLANFAGSVLVAWLAYKSGQFGAGDGALAATTIKIALSKCSLTFGRAFILGIMCNFLVCIAVWMATAADSTIGKVLCIFFPIWLFVTSGFEHSIANMYYIPAGIFAAEGGTAGLTWSAFLLNNLLPVTLGNIVGGAVLTGCAYLAALSKQPE